MRCILHYIWGCYKRTDRNESRWCACNSSGVYRCEYLHCGPLWWHKDASMDMRWIVRCTLVFFSPSLDVFVAGVRAHKKMMLAPRLVFICLLFSYLLSLSCLQPYRDVSSIICIICDAVCWCTFKCQHIRTYTPDTRLFFRLAVWTLFFLGEPYIFFFLNFCESLFLCQPLSISCVYLFM